MTATLVLAAHGARSEEWESVMGALAGRVRRARPGRRVEVGFLELSSPALTDVLAAAPGPVVVVPLLLAGGYHVHIDLPAVVARTRPDARVTRQLGPHPLLTAVLARRLVSAGLRSCDAVILGAAGSSDPAALEDVRAAARLLSVRLSRPVTAAFASAGSPSVAQALGRIRSGPAPPGGDRVLPARSRALPRTTGRLGGRHGQRPPRRRRRRGRARLEEVRRGRGRGMEDGSRDVIGPADPGAVGAEPVPDSGSPAVCLLAVSGRPGHRFPEPVSRAGSLSTFPEPFFQRGSRRFS
ncbi:sirohydrochlorin chelatase [Planotetraspora mira]|uniref:Sirohydrochlorin chelatase n=1 Tax=Planotetraspora mira TaxID=58121 RepID=A0A8J3X8H3_9ACTN|nr:CbiX/SirB N-terminal domain-containing protein [Planotetraspora mira]GII32167.1 hypothetical protein Pmi06nite_56090 [Planotetraspora mira]